MLSYRRTRWEVPPPPGTLVLLAYGERRDIQISRGKEREKTSKKGRGVERDWEGSEGSRVFARGGWKMLGKRGGMISRRGLDAHVSQDWDPFLPLS